MNEAHIHNPQIVHTIIMMKMTQRKKTTDTHIQQQHTITAIAYQDWDTKKWSKTKKNYCHAQLRSSISEKNGAGGLREASLCVYVCLNLFQTKWLKQRIIIY